MKIASCVILLLVMLGSCTYINNDLITVTHESLGTITTPINCEQEPGRYGKLVCIISTTNDLNVSVYPTNYPNNTISLGDSLGKQVRYFENRYEVSFCKNDICKKVYTCYSGLPCVGELYNN